MKTSAFVVAALLGLISGQQVGNNKAEYHLPMALGKCTKSGGCDNEQKSIVMDANWRWLHKVGGSSNCYTGNSWDKSACPDDKTCAENCALDGVPEGDWSGTYGTKSDGKELQVGFVTHGQYSVNIGARTYMLNTDSQYEMFKLLNKEFTFDVDVSNLPCGLNGALYFVEMNETGDMGGDNKAGAKYGTGYCDAQCPHDIKFINGAANSDGWQPSGSDKNAGTGKYGSCCAEMDIWEANSISSAFTAHPCTVNGQHKCEGTECGDNDSSSNGRYDGVCDKDGCDLNPYRAGVKDFFGPGSGFKVDTTQKFTIVTEFHTSDNTDTGDLVEIRRKFVQNGKVIDHPSSMIDGLDKQVDSITDDMCGKVKDIFTDKNDFKVKGGLKKMGNSMKNGMVLVMSLWDDHAANMLWLDSTYPKTMTTQGGPRGTCATTSGVPSEVEANSPNSNVKFSNIKIGEFGSTYAGNPGPGPSPPTPGGCPGGSLSACIGLCPSDPAAAFKACVETCTTRCKSNDETFLQ